VQRQQLGRRERALVERVARLDHIALGDQEPRAARQLVVLRLERLAVLVDAVGDDRDLRAAVGLLGLGKFAINWTTDETTASFLPLPVVVIGSIGRRDILGPWIVAFSLPIGAVVALLRRNHVLYMQPKPAVTPDRSDGAAE
jgi:hypothetical protein